MRIKDLVEGNRIITVDESEELYTERINDILQRELRGGRIKAISDYVLNSDERFFNSIIVAIHRGAPRWTEIDISRKFTVDDDLMDDESLSFVSHKFGVLSLTGDEVIFALDGQHRVKGLRKAFQADPTIGEKEVPLIFVVHKHEQLDRTRRLFTVLNKFAEKPRGAELIIIDEDDASAINTRKLVMEHPQLSKLAALSKSKNGNIPKSDKRSLTTLVTLDKINKKLYSKTKSFYSKRPNDEELDALYRKSELFWDTYFEVFPETVEYIDGNVEVERNNAKMKRDEELGGSLLLRPVGQELIADAYLKFPNNELDVLKRKIRLIDFRVSGPIWNYLYWDGEKMKGKEVALKKNVMEFLLGKFDDEANIVSQMTTIYSNYNLDYNNQIQPIL